MCCLLVLFATVVLAISMPFVLSKAVLTELFGHLRLKNMHSRLYLSAAVLLRVGVGFCHAYIIQSCPLLLAAIASFELVFIVLLVVLRRGFLSKSVYVCILAKNVMGCLFKCVLLVESYIFSDETRL